MEQSWKNDPRLSAMDPQKLDLLIAFSKRLAKTPKGQLLGEFVSLNREAQKKGLHFTDEETAVIAEILTERLPDAERKKLDTLRLLSRKLTKQT